MENERSAHALPDYAILVFRERGRDREIETDRQTVNYEKQPRTKKLQ